MIGQNINAYFDAAMMYPVERLEAVIRGQDKSIPAAAAMMALPLKQREMAAAGGMQAMQQPQQPSVRQQMAQASMPQMAPQSPQGMQQIPQQSPQQVAQLPENTGLMNIPAPNMQKMADGGIVAFAGDEGSLVGYNEYGVPPDLSGDDLSPAERLASIFDSNYRPYRPPVKPQAEKPQAAPAAQNATVFKDARTPPPTPPTPPVAEKKKDVGIGNIPKPPASSSMSYEDTLKKVSGADTELLGKYEKLGKEETTGMEALLKEKELNRPKGKAGESLEKYLKGKESADVGKRAENINSAFVNAGLEMASGDSPSVLANLVKGAKAGTASYKAGIDKLDAAADERAKLFASINDARLAEEKGDFKELYAAKAEIKKHEFAYKKYGVDAIAKLTGENRKVAADLFNTSQTNERALQVSQMNNATELKKAGIMAGAYGGGKSNPANLAMDNAEAAYKNWLSTGQGKLAGIGDTNKKKQDFIRQAFQLQGLPDPFGGTNTAGLDNETLSALAKYKS